jgi:uncharacterized protein (DUF885 family)
MVGLRRIASLLALSRDPTILLGPGPERRSVMLCLRFPPLRSPAMNMSRGLAVLAGFVALISASPLAAKPSAEDQRFEKFVNTTLEGFWKLNPEYAFAVGYYKHADQLVVPDAAARKAGMDFDAAVLKQLDGFDPAKLSASNRVDQVLIRNQLAADVWYTETFRGWQWQPSQYNVADSFARQLNTDYAPLDTRLKHMLARLEKVPAYYAAAKANIEKPTLEHTVLAIEQNQGALGVFDDELLKKVDASKLSKSDKALFRTRMDAAKAAITDYVAFLTAMRPALEAGGARNFRIGKELYAAKFSHDIQSGFTAEELYAKAKAEKASLHDRMELLARVLWPKVMAGKPMPQDRLDIIGAVIGELSKQHTTPDKFVETIRKQIPELEKFVTDHDIVTQDPTRPLVVRETPVYQRGVAGAGVDAPGPYDPTANTYYNVSPLDGYTPERAESYLREYNDWMLQLLNIHEAVPGHYLQLVHANKSKSLVKSLFGNGAMIEGWAVFSERVMLDAGYGGNTPEMWLIWMKWNLRAVCNTIIDYEIQTGDLGKEQMVKLLTREAFQSEAEATNKWRRATLSQVQLTSYYNGYAEITALRDEQRAKQGAAFTVKGFNDQFLSYGNAPVKFIRELMQTP